MSEVNTDGYTELRGYIETNWDVQLYDETQTTVLTLDPSDPRVGAVDSHPNLTYTIVLSGDDVDITTPQTISGGRLVSGATVVAPNEAFAEGDATLGAAGDEVTVTVTFTMPSA